MLAGVNTHSELFLGFVAAASLLEADSRVDAQGYPFFLSGNTVLQSPPLAAGGGKFQIEAPSSKSFCVFFSGLAERIAVSMRGIGGADVNRFSVRRK